MNTLTNISAQTDANGAINTITFTGTTDNTCASLRMEVLDSTTGDVLMTGPVQVVASNWSKTFTAPEDFSIADFNCNDSLRVVLKCRDTSPSVVLLDDSGPINCAVPACLITISDVFGTPSPNSGLNSLELRGTATCNSVDVSVVFNGIDIVRNNISVDSTGNWRTVFVMGDTESKTKLKSYECNENIDVTIQCSADSTCVLNTTLRIDCGGKTPCPERASLRVTGPNGFDKVNPTDDELECMPFGDYTLVCTTLATNYVWSSNDLTATGTNLARNVVSVNGNTMVVRYGATNLNWHFTVVAIKDANCVSAASAAFHCGGKPPTPPPDNNDPQLPPPDTDTDEIVNSGCDLCCVWFIANIILVFLTLVLFAIAGCVFQFVEPISFGFAISAAIATTVSIIAWAIYCRTRSGNSCIPLLRWLDILDVLSILAGIVALAVGVTSPCAIAFWINVGFLQWVRRILQTFSMIFGCSPNPWWRIG